MNDMSQIETVLAAIRTKALGSSPLRVVFISGNFNIVHAGHIRLLQFAAECGDVLVVGVFGNSAPGAILPAEMRLEAVRAIGIVDHCFLIEEPLETVVATLRPDIIVKGREHERLANPERKIVESYGGKLLFGSGNTHFSSRSLIEREYYQTDFSAIHKPTDYALRHGITLESLRHCLDRFAKLRVTVVGDLIVDEYVDCVPLGMSQEDPTIVVTPIDHKRFVGGAGIAAAHAHGLGAQARYVTVTGKDPLADFARTRLTEMDVAVTLIADDSRPTTLKRRYRAGGKTLLRVNELRQHAISPEIAAKILDAVTVALDDSDLLIFSDFNYGCLPQPLVESIAAAAAARGVRMVADSQASSQLSDISRFRDMLMITPTEREARLAMRDTDSGLVVLAENLQKAANTQNVIITLGAEGLMIFASKNSIWTTDQIPAMNTMPKDPAGAGDSFLTCSSMALCTGMDIWHSAYLGALAAACQVSRVGNTPLSRQDLLLELEAG